MNAPTQSEFIVANDDRPVSRDVLSEVERFYYREARLMNQKRHREWLETMVDPEIHYWLPITEDRFVKDKRPPPSTDDPAVYNDHLEDLDHRIARLETGLVWMEDPPSRIRHLLSNIEAFETEDQAVLLAYSNFHIYRNRRQRDETNLVGGREDLLRRDGDGKLRVYRRKINLDQRVVLDKNLYFFF